MTRDTFPTVHIWTLNARDSVFLDVVADYLNLSDFQVRREIISAHNQLVEVLASKNIDYKRLKNALIPQRDEDRHEIVLVFDSLRIKEPWYGYPIAQRILRSLPKKLTCSVKTGDFILEDQDLAFKLFQRHVLLCRECEFQHSTQFYAVYLNNLTRGMVRQIFDRLIDYEPFVGFIPATEPSKMKTWLSFTVTGACVKVDSTLIFHHEDDAPNDENYNILGWPVEENGYKYVSLQTMLYDTFLLYKIERETLPDEESDTRFGLLSMSTHAKRLADMSVEITEAKMSYLREQKAAILKRSGLSLLTIDELKEAIKEKVGQYYIYNLRFNEYGDSMFNILLKFPAIENGRVVKTLISLKYKPDEDLLFLVTMH